MIANLVYWVAYGVPVVTFGLLFVWFLLSAPLALAATAAFIFACGVIGYLLDRRNLLPNDDDPYHPR